MMKVSLYAANDHDCIADSVTSNLVALRIGPFITSLEDDQAMSDITYQPDFEPMISGVHQRHGKR